MAVADGAEEARPLRGRRMAMASTRRRRASGDWEGAAHPAAKHQRREGSGVRREYGATPVDGHGGDPALAALGKESSELARLGKRSNKFLAAHLLAH